VNRGCIALAMDKRHQRIEISTFRWSSGATMWAGFPVESHELGPRGELREFGTEHPLLGLCVRGTGTMQICDSTGVRRVNSSPGRFSLLCRGYDQKPLAWSGTREMLYVSLGGASLESLIRPGEDSPCLQINPQYAVSDPQVVALVLNMRAEIRAGCPSGRLYGEALSVALAARLQARYAYNHSPVSHPKSALSPTQVGRVCEYMRSKLSSDVGVGELAALLNLSPHYFSTLFKHAVGVSPHQYLLQERVDEARRLLALGQVPIAELAINLGFSDQSHFCRAFRKLTGMTPRCFQLERRVLETVCHSDEQDEISQRNHGLVCR
jgi:AraC family transcriptional regulator